MGRKAAKVAAKKQKGEAKRTKLYGKYGKLIVAAVKEGGGADPVANTQLARVSRTPRASPSRETSSSATSSALRTPRRRITWS
jgi:transcriptional/translational regulatory protein YebC/TACO1